MTKDERVAKAQELYAQAGYSADNPLQVEILYNTSDNHKKIAIAVAAMWKQALGVQSTLRNEEWKVYLTSRDEKAFQVVRASWIGDYNDANTFLELFLSDAGAMNSPGFANPHFDELVRAAAFQPDLAARAQMLAEAEGIFLEETPVSTSSLTTPGLRECTTR
jgi:oligopeptide transport system substrate-binding protein